MGNQPNERVIVNDRWVRADNHCPISMKLSPKCMLPYACVCVQVLKGQKVNGKPLKAFCFMLTFVFLVWVVLMTC